MPTACSKPVSTVHRTLCPLDCPDGCGLEVTVEEGRVTKIDASDAVGLTDGFICGKVRGFTDRVYGEERLATPLIRSGAKGSGEFRSAGWEEALDRIAKEMVSVRDRFGGEAILPYSYGGSNGSLTEAAVDARLFRRLGASRLLQTICAVPTSMANQGLYGSMPGVALEDHALARFVCVWGANPHASGIHGVPPVRRAQEAGAKLVVVDPRKTKLAKGADLHLALKPGTDLALALAVHRWLFENGAADLEFLDGHANQVELFRERADAWTLERAASTCDLDARDIERFAADYAAASPALIRCGWGLERNRNGGGAAAAVLALPTVAGKFGVRGGGFTMSSSKAWSLVDPVEGEPEPETRGINMNRLGRALLAELDPPIRLLFIYNANPLAMTPEQNAVRAGLEREDLFTVVFDQVMTDSARYADVVLPATTFLEHVELRKSYGAYGMQLAGPAISPVGEARPNYDVFAELVDRTGLAQTNDVTEPYELAEAIVGDAGHWRVLREEGVVTPSFGTNPLPFVDVQPRTEDGRVHLVPAELEAEAPGGLYAFRDDPGSAEYPLALLSPATSKRVNSSLGELHPGVVPVDMNPADAAERAIEDGTRVRIHNDLGEVVTRVRVTEDVRPGTLSLPKGLWRFNSENGNTSTALVPATYTDIGSGACFNDARVEVAPAP